MAIGFGKSNLNLNGYAEIREHRFINIMKSGSRIIDSGNVATYYLNQNADQYPEDDVGSENNHSLTLYAPVAGTYVCRWKGRGSATFGSWGSKSDSSKTVASGDYAAAYNGGGADNSIVTNGRFTFTIGSTLSSSMTIKSSSMSHLVVCLASEEVAHDAGDIFQQRFLDAITDGGFGGLRFMDSQLTNINCTQKWSDQLPSSAITYHTTNFVPGRKAGLAASADGAAYTLAGGYPDMPVSWTHGESFHFHPELSNTSAAPTIDVGSRGAKTIVNPYNAALTTSGTAGSTFAAARLLSTECYTGVYDAYADKVYISRFGHWTGKSLAMDIELCNVLNLPGWFSVQYYWDDQTIEDFAVYLCENYTPNWVKIEPDNEIWNQAGGDFIKTARYTLAAGVEFPPYNYHVWYNRRVRRIAEIMRPVFASYGRSSDLDIVLACQGSSGDDQATANFVISRRFDFDDENNVYDYPAISGTNAAINHCNSISYGIYYQGGLFSSGGVFFSPADATWCANRHTYRSAFSNLKAHIDAVLAGTDPDAVAAAFEFMQEDLTTNSPTFQSRFVSGTGRNDVWNNVAVTYDKPVCLYEVNHEIGPPTATWCNSAVIVLYSPTSKTLTSSKTTALPSLGFSQSGATITSAGTTGVIGVQNKLNTPAPITAATLLRGTSSTDSIQHGASAPTTWVIGVATAYTAGQRVWDTVTNDVYLINTSHTSTTASFADNRTANPSYYTLTTNLAAWEAGDKLYIVDRIWPAGASGGVALTAGQIVLDVVGGVVYEVQTNHTVPASSVFATYYADNPAYYSVYTASTIEFVASGASGNNQVNVTDTVGDLLSKIDALTGTSTSYEILTTFNDTSYGGQTGKLYQFLLEFYDSPQYETVVQQFLAYFYGKSNSEMHSLYTFATFDPWICAKKRDIATETALGGDITQGFYRNYHAHKKWNSGQRIAIGRGEAA